VDLPKDHTIAAPQNQSLFTYGQKRKVRRIKTVFSIPEWTYMVTNHPLGSMNFDTWQQAMDYANFPGWPVSEADLATMQGAVANLVLYGESTATVTSLADGRNQVTVHDHQVGP